MHASTYEYLEGIVLTAAQTFITSGGDFGKPTDAQMERMARIRAEAKAYNDVLDSELPEGPDKTFVIRAHRSNAMWANVAVTRLPDGTPRT